MLPIQIAMVMLKLHHVKRIAYAGLNADPEYDVLSVYLPDGDEQGIYVSDPAVFRRIITQYNYAVTNRGVNEIMSILHTYAVRMERSTAPDLIAVNNGIFDYRNKTLLPFSPDIVFNAKSHVNYNPNAVNATIHNPDDHTDWDVESWMHDVMDDAELEDLMWKLIGAVVRPNVKWNKSAWFYSDTGNNGKGTICALMRNIIGKGACASIPLSDFSKDFMLEPLIRANAIIVDENDVGVFIDKAANLKAVITGDTIQINRKFKTAIAYQFRGMTIQCLNEMPRIKDKSDSWLRRQLFIPFSKCFTGAERKYIKADYLERAEVLEYVLCKVLNMDYYELPEPAACKLALQEYTEFNDPVRQFAEEMLPIVQWDLLPYTFLYALYKAWFKENTPSGSMQSRNTFITDIVNAVSQNVKWKAMKKADSPLRSGKRMDKPEHLIIRYQLKDWMNPNYTGSDPDQICRPPIADRYRGLVRVVPEPVKSA
ncbi:MAG: DNA primase [Oscillospiraceae bacterium]|nr:DNA primase [Oscillospiraceae bacterium]